MKKTVEEIARQMDSLGMWESIAKYNIAIRPRGTVFPYFCTAISDDNPLVRARFLMLEGWQTLHDFVRTRADVNFGFYSSPMEMPHYELLFLKSGGDAKLMRHDPGMMPQKANAVQRKFVVKILWEVFGVMLRMENEPELPMMYSEDKSVFARVEGKDGKWSDAPLVIGDPPPYHEQILLPKELVKRAKDLPFSSDYALEVDFRIVPNLQTNEPRPRLVYALIARDAKTGVRPIHSQVSMHPEAGLRGLWETMPVQLLSELVRHGKMPGRILTKSGRVFRMLRPLCFEFPLKLSLHDKLEV